MANSTIGVNEGTNTNLDAESLTVGSNTVKRQRLQIAGSTSTDIATVSNVQPPTSAYALNVRITPAAALATVILNYASLTAGGGTSLLSASPGNRHYVVWYTLSPGVQSSIFLYSGAVGTTLIFGMRGLALADMTLSAPAGWFLCSTATNAALSIDVGTTTSVVGSIGYFTAPAPT